MLSNDHSDSLLKHNNTFYVSANRHHTIESEVREFADFVIVSVIRQLKKTVLKITIEITYPAFGIVSEYSLSQSIYYQYEQEML